MRCPEADALIGMTVALESSVVAKISHINTCDHCRDVLEQLELVRTALRPESVSDQQVAIYEKAAVAADSAARAIESHKRTLPDLLLAALVFVVSTGTAVLLFGEFSSAGDIPANPAAALPIAAPAGLLIAWESWRRDRGME